MGLITVLAVLAACAAPPRRSTDRDVLWRIVSQCLDPRAPGYCERCAWPVASACRVDTRCEATTEVWTRTVDFVAIRDIKMCGCPAGFTHGLAMPRSKVAGIEDPHRPQGIWQFAWDVARGRIADESATALLVNAPRFRSQDHLHVHLVRLRPGARDRFATRATAAISWLQDVWETAERVARTSGLPEYAVLVTRRADGQFVILVDDADLEHELTESRCR